MRLIGCGNFQVAANLANQEVVYLGMSRDGRGFGFGGVPVLGVLAAFAVELASVLFEMANKFAALHATARDTFSLSINSEGRGAPVNSWLASRVI